MTARLRLPLLAAAATAAMAGLSVPAFAQNVQVGRLSCAVSGGIGLIITSQKSMSCTFTKAGGGRERYAGTIRKFGLDIGATTRGQLVWLVYAPSGRYRTGALAGEYVGASGEVSLGAGIGANALVGGFQRSVTLQPFSAQGQIGANLALGVADLRLVRAR